MDRRLVSGVQPDSTRLLWKHQSARRIAGEQLRPPNAQYPDSPESDEGRLVSLRAKLLPALPASSENGTTDRYLDVSPRFSLYFPCDQYIGVGNDSTKMRGENPAYVNEAEPVGISMRLAFDRTRLAYDRTMMAWIRTATSLITFGFSVFKFFEFQEKTPPANLLLGPRGFAVIMISIGLISLLMATIQHRIDRNKLRSMDCEVPRSLAAALAGVIAALGIAALISVLLNR